ncbi:MAG TPA: Rnase Y domain-containing protein, partial [Saprospiraceae bacterium]|nr:Rnase Y domain-containing protein [Saprospiraceae bacterium]
MENIIALIGGLVLGGLGGYFSVRTIFKKQISEANAKSDITLKEAELTAKRKIDEAEIQAEKLVAKAQQTNENIKQQKIQEARDKFNQLKSEFESYKAEQKVAMKDREMQVLSAEKDLKSKLDEIAAKNDQIEQRESEVKAIRENLEVQLKVVAKKKDELEASIEKKIKELENIAKLSQSEAKDQLLETIRSKAQSEALSIEREAVANARSNANKEAKKIVIQTIQRMAAEYTIENTVSVFNIDSDDIKGQIIGREGRNIRALEAATGAEIVVDDTPESIVISSFDPIKREVCRLALKRLVADGRIHPAKIEEVVAKVKKQLDEQIVEIGERTIIDLDIHGLNPYLVKMVGRMRFRSSYGQNLLKHSIETANLCATMASELGLNPKQVKM